MYLLAAAHSLWDLKFPNQGPCIGSVEFYHWTNKEVQVVVIQSFSRVRLFFSLTLLQQKSMSNVFSIFPIPQIFFLKYKSNLLLFKKNFPIT